MIAGPDRLETSTREIDALHNVVLTRLRTWYRAGPERDPASITTALKLYIDAVRGLVNGDGK